MSTECAFGNFEQVSFEKRACSASAPSGGKLAGQTSKASCKGKDDDDNIDISELHMSEENAYAILIYVHQLSLYMQQ